MKLIGRILAILAAALVIVGILLVIGSFSANGSTLGGHMDSHGMQEGFNLAGIVEILPTLAIVAIITAIVAPIKQRLISKRRPSTPAQRAQSSTPAASL